MQGEYRLSDEQSPLASNDLLCLNLRFDDVWLRALYKCDHLVTFSLRGLAGEAYFRRDADEGARATSTCQLEKGKPGAAHGLKWDANSHLKFAGGEALPELVSSAGVRLSGRVAM